MTQKNSLFLYETFKLKYCLLYLTIWFGSACIVAQKADATSIADTILMAISTFVPFLRYEEAWINSFGHGVSGFPKILGLPRSIFFLTVFLCSLLLVGSFVSMDALKDFPKSRILSLLLGVNAFFSMVLGVLRWYFTVSFNTWYFEERTFRRMLTEQKLPPQEIEDTIRRLHREGKIFNNPPYC